MDVKDLSYPLFKTTKWEKKILSRAYEKIEDRSCIYVCHAIRASITWWESWLNMQETWELENKLPTLLESAIYELSEDEEVFNVGTDRTRRLEWIRQLLEYKGEN